MKNTLLKKSLLCSVILFFTLIANAQSKKKANKDTEAWRYEIEVVQTGTEGTYLIKVWSYSSKPEIAIEQSKKNAVHGIIFKGLTGTSTISGQPALTSNANLENEKTDFFKPFFADGGKYMKFVSNSNDGAIAAGDIMRVGKEFKIGVVVSVNVTALRKELESADIIKTLGEQAVNKPSIMIFPDDSWMSANGFSKEIDNQGVKTLVNDYASALLNVELGQVITKIQKMMLDRGYPLENLSQTLKAIQDADAIKSMETSEEGNSVQVSLKDKLLNSARPDLILYVNWTLNTLGPKKSVYFSMTAMDAGTNKPAGSASGTGNELIGASLGVMLETAVLSHIDNFNDQLMNTYFSEMQTKGREITVEIQVFENSPKKINSEINDDGDELSDDIQKWMKENTVNGAFTLQTKTSTLMRMTSVRIPLKTEDGTAFSADAFGTKLRKYMRKTYQISCSSYPVGTGKTVLVIGGKSQ